MTAFWPYYINEHKNPLTRRIHFWGNTNLLFWLLLAFIRRSIRLSIFAIVSSYLIAWFGHFFIEKNKPATFRYPLLAGVCDMIMYCKMLNGTMDAEVAKYLDK